MKRPAAFSSGQGLLLVEAVLSAVVMAVGLVFISRGLSSQLKAIRAIGEKDSLLILADDRLRLMEQERLHGLLPPEVSGTFAPPYEAYRWTVSARVRDDITDAGRTPLAGEVTIKVRRGEGEPSAMRLSAIWLSEWIPEAWYASSE